MISTNTKDLISWSPFMNTVRITSNKKRCGAFVLAQDYPASRGFFYAVALTFIVFFWLGLFPHPSLERTLWLL